MIRSCLSIFLMACSVGLSALSSYADFLYWLPCNTAFNFAAIDQGSNRQFFTATSDYSPGIRVGGELQGCSCFVRLSGLYLYSSDLAQVDRATNVILMSAVNPAALFSRVRARIRHHYWNIDLRVGKQIYPCWTFFGGFRWIDIEKREMTLGASTFNTVTFDQTGTFRGGALGVGIAGDFPLMFGLHIFGEIGSYGAIGNRRLANLEANIAGFLAEVATTSATCIIPALDYRAGLGWTFCLCGTDVSVLVGYEWQHYFEAIRMISLNAGVQLGNALPLPLTDVGYGGPFVRLNAQF